MTDKEEKLAYLLTQMLNVLKENTEEKEEIIYEEPFDKDEPFDAEKEIEKDRLYTKSLRMTKEQFNNAKLGY